MNPFLEPRENILFSIVLNQNPLGSWKVVNSYEEFSGNMLDRASLRLTADGGEMGKALALRGIIVPCNWDEQDNITSIALSAIDEKEYPIEMNNMGKNLLKHITHEVRLEGHLYRDTELDRDMFSVKLFKLLN